jgi:hypothetical protein
VLIKLCICATDNRMVGAVMVDSHPVYGSASLSIRSGKTYRTVSTVGASGATVGATVVPTTSDTTLVFDLHSAAKSD